MTRSLGIGAFVLIGVLALACDSLELTVAVNRNPDRSLSVSNANDTEWVDVRLVVEGVEGDGVVRPCGDQTIATWRPNQIITVPECADKVRLTVTTGGETARFAYYNGALFRRIGRKEIPIKQ